MSKITTTYGRFGKVTTIDGKEVTEEELAAYFAHKPSLEETLATEEGRAGLVNAMRRDNGMYEHGWSDTCGMPRHQAAEHAAWIKSKGLVGVEVITTDERDPATGRSLKGKIRFAGPKNKEDYLAARNSVDDSPAGTGLTVGMGKSRRAKKTNNRRKKRGT